jgi:hypothetical protein
MPSQPEKLGPEEESVRLLAILIRLMLPSQSATIAELARAGFKSARIATLLGTSANTVNVTVQKQKRAGKPTAPKVRPLAARNAPANEETSE